nr:immunoglobulin light chain junction region [Macaca mulatta]
CQQGYTLPYTF